MFFMFEKGVKIKYLLYKFNVFYLLIIKIYVLGKISFNL